MAIRVDILIFEKISRKNILKSQDPKKQKFVSGHFVFNEILVELNLDDVFEVLLMVGLKF